MSSNERCLLYSVVIGPFPCAIVHLDHVCNTIFHVLFSVVDNE